jgi:hypothetical protein
LSYVEVFHRFDSRTNEKLNPRINTFNLHAAAPSSTADNRSDPMHCTLQVRASMASSVAVEKRSNAHVRTMRKAKAETSTDYWVFSRRGTGDDDASN